MSSRCSAHPRGQETARSLAPAGAANRSVPRGVRREAFGERDGPGLRNGEERACTPCEVPDLLADCLNGPTKPETEPDLLVGRELTTADQNPTAANRVQKKAPPASRIFWALSSVTPQRLQQGAPEGGQTEGSALEGVRRPLASPSRQGLRGPPPVMLDTPAATPPSGAVLCTPLAVMTSQGAPLGRTPLGGTPSQRLPFGSGEGRNGGQETAPRRSPRSSQGERCKSQEGGAAAQETPEDHRSGYGARTGLTPLLQWL